MGIPRYERPTTERTHREQPTVYTEPATFAHPAPREWPKDTPVSVEAIEPVHPVPVTVVSMPRTADRIVSWNAANFAIPVSGELMVASRNDNRVRLRLINADAAKTVYVNLRSGAQTQGYPLLPGKEWFTESTREVYVYNPDAGVTVQVGIVYDYVAELT